MIFIVDTTAPMSEDEVEALPQFAEAVEVAGFDHVQQVADAAVAGDQLPGS